MELREKIIEHIKCMEKDVKSLGADVDEDKFDEYTILLVADLENVNIIDFTFGAVTYDYGDGCDYEKIEVKTMLKRDGKNSLELIFCSDVNIKKYFNYNNIDEIVDIIVEYQEKCEKVRECLKHISL